MLTNRPTQNNNLREPLLSAAADHVIDIPKSSSYLTELLNTLETARTELESGVAILEKQRAKKFVPSMFLHIMMQTIFIVTILSSLKNMLNSAAQFDIALGKYYNTIEPSPWGWQPPANCSAVWASPVGSDSFYQANDQDTCNFLVGLMLDNNPKCADALQSVCDSPNMWSGYLLTIIDLGMVLPGVFSVLALCISANYNLFSGRAKLSHENQVYLKALSEVYGVGFEETNTTYHNYLLFDDQLTKINQAIQLIHNLDRKDWITINDYAKRHVLTPFKTSDFLLEPIQYVSDHFTFILKHNKKSLRRELHQTIADEISQLGGGLVKHIGEYAGFGIAEEWVNPVISTLIKGQHPKNEKATLQTFFKRIDTHYQETHEREFHAAEGNILLQQEFKRRQAESKSQIVNRITMFAGLHEEFKYPLTVSASKPRIR